MRPHIFQFITALFMIVLIQSCNSEKTENYPDGQIKSVQHFKGKKQHGICTWYYDNGKKQLEAEYINGKLTGKSVRWHYNGQKESSETFKDGIRNGPAFYWNVTGLKTEERTYKNDTLDGPYKLYHETGSIKIEGHYLKGNYDKTWTYYNEFGFKIGDGTFKNGSGEQRAFHLNGKLWREVPFRDNLRNGIVKEYNQAGKLVKETVYENDVQIRETDYLK